jgi:hypothetical protein
MDIESDIAGFSSLAPLDWVSLRAGGGGCEVVYRKE